MSSDTSRDIIVANHIDDFLYERRMKREYNEFIKIFLEYLASNLSRIKSMDEQDGKFVMTYKDTVLKDLIIP